jgi:hypothetical protein
VTADFAPRAGLLHTVPALAGEFQARLDAARPGIDLVHIVDPSLLADAIQEGVTESVTRRVARHIDYLVRAGADAVLVTCSSIGEAVDAAASSAGVSVLRVDRPMATDAVARARSAGRAAGRPGAVTVLATLQATLGPTGRLIEAAAAVGSEATGDGAPDGTAADGTAPVVTVTARVVGGAAEARKAGDQAAHDRLVREAVAEASAHSDVIVLAQASMAAAIEAEHRPVPVPVLTSPAGGVTALLSALLTALPTALPNAQPARRE